MSPLADTQSLLRHALVSGEAAGVVPLLVGGRDAEKRLAIHRRHYETSLVTALLGKFPATVWLVGAPFVTEAARHFVREHPPHVPCIAEYGAEFPAFLSKRPTAASVPYLREFAEVEWSIGLVSVAVDRPAVLAAAFSRIDAEVLPDVTLTLQPGLRYLDAAWPVDDVMKLYLTATAPDQLLLEPTCVWLEVRGARGAFRINRLDHAEFVFRRATFEGRSIGDAAERALDADTKFDPGRALAALIGDGLVVAISPSVARGER